MLDGRARGTEPNLGADPEPMEAREEVFQGGLGDEGWEYPYVCLNQFIFVVRRDLLYRYVGKKCCQSGRLQNIRTSLVRLARRLNGVGVRASLYLRILSSNELLGTDSFSINLRT